MTNNDGPIPIVCLDGSAVGAYYIFNPNDWQGATRGVIQSCATECSVLQHSATRIEAICRSAKDLCQHHFDNLSRQWQTSPWDLAKTVCYGQVPEIHVLIEGFFAGLKSLLDLNAQLLSTEGIVGVRLTGFHRDKEIYGGVVLNALDRNAREGKKDAAAAIKNLITEHKSLWIDEVIESRDMLVHPARGAQQLMFEIKLEQRDGSLVYGNAVPPHVGDATIWQYAVARLQNIREFSAGLLPKLHEAA